MIEVVLLRNGTLRARAECDDPESAVLAARTLWDDEYDFAGIAGLDRRSMTILFLVDDMMVRMVEGQRP